MKQIFVYFMLFMSACSLRAQLGELPKQTLDLVKESYVIYESNPTHKLGSDSIMYLLHESMQYCLLSNGSKADNEKATTIFNLLYRNSSSLYSDSPEERRMKLRRAACFLSLALVSNTDESLTYLSYAKFTLAENINNPKVELLEEPYLGLMFLELFFKLQAGDSFNEDLLTLKNFVEKNKENLSEEIIQSANKLIKEYQEIK